MAVSKLVYQLSYMFNLTPWDVDTIPVEIRDTLQSHTFSPKNALDVGCGTGAYSLYLAKQGWQVIGMDYVVSAIMQANLKAEAASIKVDFRVGDITQLRELELPPTQLVLDIKCSHSLDIEARRGYVKGLWNVMADDGLLLLEVLRPRQELGIRFGLSDADVQETYGQKFLLKNSILGNGSAWYWLYKT